MRRLQRSYPENHCPLFVLLPARKCMDIPRVAALHHKMPCDETIQISDELSL
jgi:hypothetical protein